MNIDQHKWRGEQKTYEQFQRERLGSTAFDQHEAAKDAQAERAESRFAAASIPPVTKADIECAESLIEAANAQCEFERGIELVDRKKAAALLTRLIKHGLQVGSDFERHLRGVAGWRQKDSLPAQEQEPYEQHAMGYDEQ